MSDVATDLLLLETLIPTAPIEAKLRFSELSDDGREVAIFFAAWVVRENHERELRQTEELKSVYKFLRSLRHGYLAPDRMFDVERASPVEDFLRFAIFDADEREDEEWIEMLYSEGLGVFAVPLVARSFYRRTVRPATPEELRAEVIRRLGVSSETAANLIADARAKGLDNVTGFLRAAPKNWLLHGGLDRHREREGQSPNEVWAELREHFLPR